MIRTEAIDRRTDGRTGTLRRVTVSRGGHRWSFVFARPDEPAVIRRLTDLARDSGAAFDWLDVLAVCRLMARASAVASSGISPMFPSTAQRDAPRGSGQEPTPAAAADAVGA